MKIPTYRLLMLLLLDFCSSAFAMAGAQAYDEDDQLCIYYQGNIVFQTNISKVDSIAFSFSKTKVNVVGKDGTILFSTFRGRIDSIGFKQLASYPEFNIQSARGMTATYDEDTKEYTFTTTNGDPHIYTNYLDNDLPVEKRMFTFEYQCSQAVDNMQLFFGNTISETRSKFIGSLSATTGSEWRTFSYDVGMLRSKFSWGMAGERIRLDMGSNSGVTLKIRHAYFRELTEGEKKAVAPSDSAYAAKRRIARDIIAYLDTTYSSSVDSVGVSRMRVTIKGRYNGDKSFALVEVPPYEDVTEVKRFPYRTTLTDKSFSVSMNRRINRDGITYDRALSKWAIVEVEADSDRLVSHAHYADTIVPTYSAKRGLLKNKKGIGAGNADDVPTYYNDFDSLQVGSITTNIVLDYLISKTGGAGYTPYSYGGKTYYINNAIMSQYDQMMTEAYKRSIVVSAILLLYTGSIFTDPENNGGTYTMPNMTTAEAVNDYAAALSYLASRYSTGQHGRIHHWIIHNEIDYAGTYANMGEQPEARLYDRYIKSMRMCYNIVRQYDSNAYVLGSYTHSWNVPDDDYSPRLMLEQNVKFSNTEGDFKWGIAYHPYPLNLLVPEFWSRDGAKATFNNDTRYVTFHNPEVIDAWVKNPAHFYKGKTKRLLFFSENGTNSRDYTDEQLTLQAAGAALIWKKIELLDGVDAIQWHNWRDHGEEFGLRIGLRSWKEGKFENLTPKPAWYVWKAAGTPNEDKVFQPYLKVIGISDWNNIIHTVK